MSYYWFLPRRIVKKKQKKRMIIKVVKKAAKYYKSNYEKFTKKEKELKRQYSKTGTINQSNNAKNE